MMQAAQTMKLIFLTLALMVSGRRLTDAFVVCPSHVARQQQLQEDKPGARTTGSHLVVLNASNDKNILARAANKIGSWFAKNKKENDDDTAVELLSRHDDGVALANEMKQALESFPWPLRETTESVTRSVSRGLLREERKAKPLLHQAQKLIQSDAEVCDVLGTPIKFGDIVSQSSETTVSVINNKRTKVIRIVDTFQVEGSKQNGIAILAADKYAKGHLQKLRVNVKGIHYDIDV